MEARSLAQSVNKSRSERVAERQIIQPVFPLTLAKANEPGRMDAEQFIYQRFEKQHGAEISHFLPFILSARTGGLVSAALGFQPASYSSHLFLEYYLDNDIQTTLSILTQTVVQRDAIVEIGNLASGRQRATQTLFLLLAELFYQAGYEWVVFTANSAVSQWLAKLDIETIAIRVADPTRLPDKGASWGSYYDDKPVVVASHIHQTMAKLNNNPLMLYLRQSYQHQLNEFVASFRHD